MAIDTKCDPRFSSAEASGTCAGIEGVVRLPRAE
jgi:hypothetical protein